MSADEKSQEADHTDAGRGRDVGSGYPEEQPPGANPGAKKQERGGGGESAPGTAGDRDSDPAAATGNPGAAGGEG
jgi:hypothetical protein